MEKLSINVILGVSVPEQILYLITVLLMVARLDLIRLYKENVFKLTAVVLINTVFVVWLREVSASFLLNVVLLVGFMAFTYIAILKVNPYETVIASLLAYFEFFAIEFVTSVIIIWAFHLDFEKIFNNDLARVIITLPIRALEIGAFFALLRVGTVIIDLKPLRYTVEFVKKFTFLAVCLLLGLMYTASCIKFTVFDLRLAITPQTTSFLLGTVVFITVLFLAVFATIKKVQKIENSYKDNHIDTLLYIKDCLKNGSDGIMEINELINEELKQGGYKNEK